MGKDLQRGFTIIETMLVLAVTGVLIATLLVGVGGSVGNQRYKDSVLSMKTVFQSQFSLSDNVTNERDDSWSCGSAAVPVQAGAGVTSGQSDCVVLGRYLAIVDSDITQGTIIGYKSGNNTSATLSDVAKMKLNYQFGLAQDSVTTSTLEWGARIAWAKTPTTGLDYKATASRSFALLVIRSPTSGTTFTFNSNTVTATTSLNSTNIKAMMVESITVVPGQAPRTICIASDGNGAETLGIYIAPGASGATSIETRTNATTASLTQSPQVAIKC